MSRILVVSEGASELGKMVPKSTVPAAPVRVGALAILVQRLLNSNAVFEHRQMSDNRLQVHAGKGARLEKRALAWMRVAEREGFDALVLVIDEDGDKARAAHFERAQSNIEISFPRALGIAIRTFDAWMLADERALSNVLGMTVSCQPEIENLKDPKSILQRIFAAAGRSFGEIYSQISDECSLELVEGRCPRGFGAFACRVRALEIEL